MPKVAVYDMRGAQVGEIDLNDNVFGIQPNEAVMQQFVKMQLANKRVGNAATKTRAEVRGGGKKPWKQKGTGRARVGSTRNPVWRGGGIVFGPKPRDYSFKLPRKVRRLALKSALSSKAFDSSIIVVDATKDIDNIVQLFKENKADSILISKKLFLEFFFNKRVPEINGKCRKLTERETEIIKLKVSGLRNKEIANILGITEDTLETHITHINQKTGSKTLRESISKIL
jgi:50S ribosomal protein L4